MDLSSGGGSWRGPGGAVVPAGVSPILYPSKQPEYGPEGSSPLLRSGGDAMSSTEGRWIDRSVCNGSPGGAQGGIMLSHVRVLG